jgi:hypothetical protein
LLKIVSYALHSVDQHHIRLCGELDELYRHGELGRFALEGLLRDVAGLRRHARDVDPGVAPVIAITMLA